MPKTSGAGLSPGLFQFLTELERNNNRAWFEAHRQRYEEQVREPCLRLIAAVAEPLRGISTQLVASPKRVGGSLFRIHRDVRFSGDKSPYKTHVGITFYHAATKATPRAQASGELLGRLDAPVLYLHLQPGQSFVGGGIWHPQPETLARVRRFMLNSPRGWKQATRPPGLPKNWALSGDTLSRPPKGFDPKHELIEDLKRKDFIATAPLTDQEILAPGLERRLLAHYRKVAPLCDWLCDALDLEF